MSPSLFLLPITYHFFTVLLVLWVFIVRREIITERPNHRADIPRACFSLDSSAMSIRILSSVSLRFSLPFILSFFPVRDTCAPITYAIFSSCSQLDLVKAIVDATTDHGPRCIQFSFFARRFCPIDVVFPLFTFVADWLYSLYSIFFPLPTFLLASSFPVASSSTDGVLVAGIIITFSPPTRGRRIEEGRFNYFIAWPATATSVPLPSYRPCPLSPPCPSWYRTRWDARRDWRFINIAVLARVSRCLY